jgi:hypothetical protein
MGESDSKSVFKSVTVIGAALSLGSGLEVLRDALAVVPVDALPPKAGSIVTASVGILGAVLSIIGRLRANQKLRLF